MFIQSSNSVQIAEEISDLVGDNTAIIYLAEHTEVNVIELIENLNQRNVIFMGGVFPKVIHEEKVHEKGIVVDILYNVESLQLVKNLSKKTYNISSFDFEKDQNYCLITFVDGLTTHISDYLEKLYEIYGIQTNYFGGGTGSLSLEQKPCVFCKDGFHEDAAIFSILRTNSNIGVDHGWQKISGPFIVTKAKGNIIKEINWKSPGEIYKSIVEEHSHQKFNDDNFFDIAKGYPFGILKDDAKYVVRDPLKINRNGEIVCIGELENNMLIDILYGEKADLISAAKKASVESMENSNNIRRAIVIDCISRVLFLEDDFKKELSEISSTVHKKYPDVEITGALTLGEISSYGNGFLEFYNKTVVVGLFGYEN
jgi:hypothetical protein